MDEAPTTNDKRAARTQSVDIGVAPWAAAGFARAGFHDPRLVMHWREIVGGQTARLCLPVRLAGGVLTLKAEPGANTFLSYETRGLAERINAYLGGQFVTRIKIVTGTLPQAEPAPPRWTASETVAADDPVRMFDGPENLRGALLRLAKARKGHMLR